MKFLLITSSNGSDTAEKLRRLEPEAIVVELDEERDEDLIASFGSKGVAGSTASTNGHHFDELTSREREVLLLMTEGVTSNSDLAVALGVSDNTVKFHVRNILDKLRLNDRCQAVGLALRAGFTKSARNGDRQQKHGADG